MKWSFRSYGDIFKLKEMQVELSLIQCPLCALFTVMREVIYIKLIIALTDNLIQIIAQGT